MQRRKFLQTASLLPFVPKPLFEKENHPREIVGTGNAGNAPDGARDFFFKPVGAWAADFIPLYTEGAFHLFFLLDWRDGEKHGEGTPWYRVSTTDFVNFTEHGEILPRGTKEEQDLYVFTGSAIKAQGKYHIFYTGHNPYFQSKGKPVQGIMHAVSDDMTQWKKLPEQTFYAPKDKYEPDDWRDAFVFWNEENKEYNMLLAARFKKGIPRRRGLTALCASKDLEKWESRDAFYAPDLYFTHECPDLFKMGEWWYLLFSEFTDRVRTRYRMSHSLKGPWIIPKRDDFDGHAFYAAKTASDGKKRFIFGWNPTRDGAKDNGGWNWGGNLVVHEIHQEPDGELSVRVPDTVKKAFKSTQPFTFKAETSSALVDNGVVKIKAAGTFGAATAGKMPQTCRISTVIEFEKGTKECGLMLRTSDDLDTTYYIRLEPRNARLVFDKWPRDRSEVFEMVELEREIALTPGVPHHLEVLIDGNKGVAYLNDKIAMNFRAYDIAEGNWGVFACEGTAIFRNTTIATL